MADNLNQMEKDWIAEMKASPGIPLWAPGKTPRFAAELGQPEPSIVPFLLDKTDGAHGAVIVCPGGGYEFKAPHEGRPIARRLNDAGIHAFVLDYRVLPYTIDCSLLDVQRAIRLVRHNAAEWGIHPGKIGVLGFSAGGHLAIMASEKFDGGDPDSADAIERESSRPDAQAPCYPAVSLWQISRQEDSAQWVKNLFGRAYSEEDVKAVSGELCVRRDTPPAFLWGTWHDFLYEQWPPFLEALKSNGVEYSFHLFPQGGHGMGLAQEDPQACQWAQLCVQWLKALGF